MSCDEYCCNHGCNQGRDCPARVAKIGQRSRAYDYVPEPGWRRNIKHLATWMLITIAMMLACAVIVGVLI